MLIHVVKPGEALWQISSFYRVPASKIIDINELPNANLLLIGEALVIPTEDTFHTVKSGETLWKIAQTYGTSIQAIVQANQIANPASIYPGLTIYIPALRHIVKRGEALWRIAQIYGTTVQDILKVNNIDNPNLVYPGAVLVIPRKRRPVIEVNGYIYILSEAAIPIVAEDAEHLTYLSPFAYRIREDGNLQAIKDTEAVNTAIAENVTPIMCITNFTSTELGENLAHIILSSVDIQNLLLQNVINIMRNKGYKALNVDFENVLPEDRELYNQFMQRASDSMHTAGYLISSALAPKLSAEQHGLLYTAHDYPAHGRIADFVVLMTYEWGWRFGPPQAISPLNQIKRVLDYAVSVMPRDKIFFGFQIYARDWLLPHVKGQEAETFSMEEAMARARRYYATIQYDTTTESPYFRYTDEQGRMHEVWFEDARSAQAKFNVVKSYKLRGVSYWALGYPFPQNWALLEDNFTIKKR
ncbi:MAG TPA: LysM peptidoglycan-binding domain-containing protein [Clostridia bacterium]|nr:LysM peptidoglycan-binding domain-containing protein [Clostridia bacterium]